MNKTEPKLGDQVKSKSTRKVGKVIEVNDYYGWFKVRFEDGSSREYKMSSDALLILDHKRAEALADKRLKEENLGITNYWRE